MINSILDAYERENDKWLESLPVCSECGEHIQDEYLYEIGGELYCESCMEKFHLPTERFMED